MRDPIIEETMNRRTFLGTTLTAGIVGVLVGMKPIQAVQGQDKSWQESKKK